MKDAIAALGSRLRLNPDRSAHLVSLCDALFAQTRHLHGLTKPTGRLVRLVAMLRQAALDPANHGAGAALVGNAIDALPLSRSRKAILQRAASWKAGDDCRPQAFAPPGSRDEALTDIAARVAAIVHIAEGLDELRLQDTTIAGIRDDGSDVDICLAESASARENAIVALEQAELWNRVALRPLHAVIVTREPRSVAPAIAPTDGAAEVARRMLLRQLEQLLSRQHGLAYDEDPEYVHEMRVATRRLRAGIRVFRKAFVGQLAAEGEHFRELAARLGDTRDADVFIEFLQDFRDQGPKANRGFLAGMIRTQRRQRQKRHDQLLTAFRAPRQQELLRQVYLRWQQPVDGPGGLVADVKQGEKPLYKRAKKALAKRLDQALAFGRHLEDLPAERQHELRIACKKLRYSAEFFACLYDDGLKDLIDTLTELQDLLGQSHDADVYAARLEEYYAQTFAGREHVKAATALESVRGQLRKQRKQAVAAATELWKNFSARPHQARLAQRLQSPREK